MSFDTSWNIDECKNRYESCSVWQFRKTFLTVNKHKYPKDRLLTLSNIFMNIEFEGCRYPKPTMDHIEKLSKGFVEDLKFFPEITKISSIDSNAAEVKDNENAHKKANYLTPWDQYCIIPGFILVTNNYKPQTSREVINQSCRFSGIERPSVEYVHQSEDHYRAKLYLQGQLLIAVGDSFTKKLALGNAMDIAFEILKEMCFTIEVKEYRQSQILLLDVMDDSTIDTLNYTTHHKKISENKFGSKILKSMGWKEGNGLGKNNQGITSPIETIRFKKRFGLNIENYDTNASTNRTHLADFNVQANKYIMRFFYGPKKRLSFSTEFTKDERKIIHLICVKVGIWTKVYKKYKNKGQLLIVKKQTPKEIFDELCNYSNFENDYYTLLPPRNESEN